MSSKKACIMMGLLVLVVGVITCAAPVAADDCGQCADIWIDDMRIRPNQYAETNVRSHVDHATNGFWFLAYYDGELVTYEGWAPGSLTRNSLISVSGPKSITEYAGTSDDICAFEEGSIGNCEELSILIADLTGISGEGSLIRLNFSASDPGGAGLALLSGTQTRNGDTQRCNCEYIVPLLVGNTMGDCDGNGRITSNDALLALRQVNREETGQDPMAVLISCDMDGNAILDILDVLEILRQAAAGSSHVRASVAGSKGIGSESTPGGTTTTPVRTTATTPICAKGYTLCKSKCVNLLTDSTNCGMCGNACTTGQACSAGTCDASLRK